MRNTNENQGGVTHGAGVVSETGLSFRPGHSTSSKFHTARCNVYWADPDPDRSPQITVLSPQIPGGV